MAARHTCLYVEPWNVEMKPLKQFLSSINMLNLTKQHQSSKGVIYGYQPPSPKMKRGGGENKAKRGELKGKTENL